MVAKFDWSLDNNKNIWWDNALSTYPIIWLSLFITRTALESYTLFGSGTSITFLFRSPTIDECFNPVMLKWIVLDTDDGKGGLGKLEGAGEFDCSSCWCWRVTKIRGVVQTIPLYYHWVEDDGYEVYFWWTKQYIHYTEGVRQHHNLLLCSKFCIRTATVFFG